MGKFIDVTGMKFGRLEVLKRIENRWVGMGRLTKAPEHKYARGHNQKGRSWRWRDDKDKN